MEAAWILPILSPRRWFPSLPVSPLITRPFGRHPEKIAFEKAGILKRGCPAVFGGGAPEAESVVIAAARGKGGADDRCDRRRLRNIRHDLCGSRFDFFPWQELSIPLLGVYQPDNAATVLTVVETLRAGGIEIPTRQCAQASPSYGRRALKSSVTIRW